MARALACSPGRSLASGVTLCGLRCAGGGDLEGSPLLHASLADTRLSDRGALVSAVILVALEITGYWRHQSGWLAFEAFWRSFSSRC